MIEETVVTVMQGGGELRQRMWENGLLPRAATAGGASGRHNEPARLAVVPWARFFTVAFPTECLKVISAQDVRKHVRAVFR